jgi:hypothetical protein
MATASADPPKPLKTPQRLPGSEDPLDLLKDGAASYDDETPNHHSSHNGTAKSGLTKDSYEYDGAGGGGLDKGHFHGYGYGGDGDGADDWDKYDFDDDEDGWSWSSILLIVLLVGMVVLFLWSQRHAMLNAWHRRQARLAFPKDATMQGDEMTSTSEIKPVSRWFGTTSVVPVSIELDGTTHKIGASRETFGQGLTQLPFALTDACAESGFPELQSLDIVDLCISKRAELRFEGCRGGALQLVDAHTTVDDVMMAKAFHIKVLPASPA